MTFRKIINSTTADSSDVNDDFYHIGQGARLPMGGDTLGYTNSTYDIGESTHKWSDINCVTIRLNGSIGSLVCISSQILSTTSERIEITGLNSTNDKMYMIKYNSSYQQPTGTGYFLIYPNGSSNATYHLTRTYFSIGNTITCNSTTTLTATAMTIGHYLNGVTTGSQFCSGEVYLFFDRNGNAGVNTQTSLYSRWTTGFGNYIYETGLASGREFPCSTITSIVIEGRFGVNSFIELYVVR